MTADKTVEVGRILGPHGLRGEVRVRLHWAGSEALLGAREALVRRAGQPDAVLAVASVRPGPHGPLLGFSGVTDRDAASAFSGATLLVERSALPALVEGEFYLVDLIGAEVVGPDGPLGQVVELRSHPSVDCLVIRLLDGREAEQPLTEPWIASVDLEHKRVELVSSEGLVV